MSLDTRQITIVFTDNIDASTITDDAVKLTKISSTGEYVDTFSPIEMAKKLTVIGYKLVIDF